MDRCELCASDRLNPVYHPLHSAQTIVLCAVCGLCQSLPRNRQSQGTVAISGEADWGNIRIGKGLRVTQHVQWLGSQISGHILDIGSNRGAFLRALIERGSDFRVDGVEPDKRLVPALEGLPFHDLWWDRIENLDLPDSHYDFMYCSHTLEHVERPGQVLRQLKGALRDTGALFMEVPDLAFIKRSDVYEEFFIDKHRYHFSRESLENLIRTTGWQAKTWFKDPLGENLSVLLIKGKVETLKRNSLGPDLFQNYGTRLAENRNALRKRIDELPAHRRCVCFGGGRLFDIARRYGGFRPFAVVDTHLSRHINELDGIPVFTPQDLVSLEPDLVVLASRGFAVEMERTVRVMLPDVKVYPLFSGADHA